MIIHIYGASGSGTSTLGRAISKELGLAFMDTDEYFWKPTDPPMTQKRERAERLERLRRREYARFGERIRPGGDMYRQHMDFLEWAAAYDTGDRNMRSKAEHDAWEKRLLCPQIVMNGAEVLEENVRSVREYVSVHFQ